MSEVANSGEAPRAPGAPSASSGPAPGGLVATPESPQLLHRLWRFVLRYLAARRVAFWDFFARGNDPETANPYQDLASPMVTSRPLNVLGATEMEVGAARFQPFSDE